MSFRNAKADARSCSQQWFAWIDRTRSELAAIGVPAEAYVDDSHWLDFLQNGHLHWHDSTGFDFSDLSPAQLAALRRFLEREYGEAKSCPPLLTWVRVRTDATTR
ncbi:MAG TPA: hypothetical protein VGN57_20740 [Pirellulaceae bacterium]|jgi:hypothetical protein|nr:hypothetical protein [Pirellulaceae bacterium]